MTDEKQPTIGVRENGPLVARNISTMRDAQGNEIETKPIMALCRCGHSANKPFCDGTHNRIGFDSGPGTPAGPDRLFEYAGAEVTVCYNPRLCSHAARCGALAPQVFDPAQKPWVQPDKGSRAEIEAVIAACPSGALSLGEGQHLFAERAEITVEKNGPYRVNGPQVEAPLPGKGATPDKVVLCRCGLSGNKPYCDGSHRDAGWKDDA